MKKLIPIFLLTIFCFSAAMAQDEKLKPTDDEALVTILVTDFDGVPEQGAVVKLSNADKSIVKEFVVGEDGKKDILLPEGGNFNVRVEKFDTAFKFTGVEIPSMPGALMFEYGFKIKVVTNYVRTFKLENVYFDTNKWDLKPESYPALSGLLSSMKGNKKMKIEIAGHTDSQGDDASNMLLSQRRANAVMEYLISKGVEPERMIAKGYGETVPVASNETADGRAQNRRTEVRIISE